MKCGNFHTLDKKYRINHDSLVVLLSDTESYQTKNKKKAPVLEEILVCMVKLIDSANCTKRCVYLVAMSSHPLTRELASE